MLTLKKDANQGLLNLVSAEIYGLARHWKDKLNALWTTCYRDRMGAMVTILHYLGNYSAIV